MLEEELRVELVEGSWSAVQAARDIVAGGAQDEPFYVCDLRELAARHARWRALLPRVEPFYAVKCNDDRMLLRTLAALGTGFDCASRSEIELVAGLGVAPERIIYANTIKMASHVRYAASVGVMMMTFDSEAELIKIKQQMPHAQVVLRIRCDAKRSQLVLGEKFGCEPAAEAPALLKLAAVLGLELIGVSFHVGTIAQELEAYARAIRHCRALFTLGAALGHARMRLVDIGGGFPGNSGTSIKEVAAVINAALETHFPEPGVRVIAEPGRYFASAAYTLAVMVHGKREVAAKDDTGEAHTMYYINAGVYSAFIGVPCEGEQPEPILLHVGSWLYFRDRGAYTMTLTTNFNGFAPPRATHFADRCLWSILKNKSPFSELHFTAVAGQERGERRAVFAECALSSSDSLDRNTASLLELNA